MIYIVYRFSFNGYCRLNIKAYLWFATRNTSPTQGNGGIYSYGVLGWVLLAWWLSATTGKLETIRDERNQFLNGLCKQGPMCTDEDSSGFLFVWRSWRVRSWEALLRGFDISVQAGLKHAKDMHACCCATSLKVDTKISLLVSDNCGLIRKAEKIVFFSPYTSIERGTLNAFNCKTTQSNVFCAERFADARIIIFLHELSNRIVAFLSALRSRNFNQHQGAGGFRACWPLRLVKRSYWNTTCYSILELRFRTFLLPTQLG